MRHQLLVVKVALGIAVGTITLFSATIAQAVGTVDVQVLSTQSGQYTGGANANARNAQTFIAGASGQLDRATVYIQRTNSVGTVYVEIWATQTVGGVIEPVGPALASQAVAEASIGTSFSNVVVDFSSPATIVSGTSYALVLRAPGAGATCGMMCQTSYYWAQESNSISGQSTDSGDQGVSWGGQASYDHVFATFVTPASSPSPSSSSSPSSTPVSTAAPTLVTTGAPDIRLLAVLPAFAVAVGTLMLFSKRRRGERGK